MSPNRETKILVVDDDDANRYFKVHVLERHGYPVCEAALGADALRQLETEEPVLVLLDVKLPDGSGIEICRRIKALKPSTIVLQTSAAFTKGQDRVAGLEGGADAYLIEPMEPNELYATVSALLRLHEAEQKLRGLNETLEQRVAERTRDLAAANRQLAAESEQRAKAEEALRHAQKLDALGQLTGGVAHDFNNLLTVVLGNLDLIEHGLEAPAGISLAEIGRMVGGARRAAEKCERLTDQLLAFARRDVVKLDIVDVNVVLTQFDNLLRRALGESIAIKLSLGRDLWACQVDLSQFEAAVLNLAVNARDAIGAAGELNIATSNLEIQSVSELQASSALIPTDFRPGQYVRISVSDSGSGMSAEVLSHAFEPFFTTKEIGQGSGLGLSQVYGFVRQSGGYLAVDSKLGVGTTVSLQLPRCEARPLRTGAGPGIDDHPTVDHETILVVEDNAVVREFVTEMLDELGYRVLPVPDGRAALEVITRGEAVDLLFTDVVMPNDMSGMELAREARRLRPTLKVLVTSGYTNYRRATDIGDQEFPSILKPYRRAELASRIREILAQ